MSVDVDDVLVFIECSHMRCRWRLGLVLFYEGLLKVSSEDSPLLDCAMRLMLSQSKQKNTTHASDEEVKS